MKHLLKLESLPREDFDEILRDTAIFKRERGRHSQQPLAGQTWALMFSKQSTRTRLSFEVGIRELGGMPMFLSALDIQLGRGEPIKDTARVMGRMVHGAVIRTFAQQDVEEFARYSGIPTLNALTDDEHPCQILADIFTFQERRGSIEGKTVAFIGDGACNVANSWIWAAAKFDFSLRIAARKSPGDGRYSNRRERGRFIVHGCLDFHGQGGRSEGTWRNFGRLPNQPGVGAAGQTGGPGDALPARLSRQGN
jgi:ornithine carbamoyltransferase